MNTKLATSLFIAAAAVTGAFSQIAPAAALSASSSVWDKPQPTVYSKSQTGFNDSIYQKFVQKALPFPTVGNFNSTPAN